MISTVKDCLKLNAFKDATLIAGSSGLKRRVKSVTVLENFDNLDNIKNVSKKQELVLTSFCQ